MSLSMRQVRSRAQPRSALKLLGVGVATAVIMIAALRWSEQQRRPSPLPGIGGSMLQLGDHEALGGVDPAIEALWRITGGEREARARATTESAAEVADELPWPREHTRRAMGWLDGTGGRYDAEEALRMMVTAQTLGDPLAELWFAVWQARGAFTQGPDPDAARSAAVAAAASLINETRHRTAPQTSRRADVWLAVAFAIDAGLLGEADGELLDQLATNAEHEFSNKGARLDPTHAAEAPLLRDAMERAVAHGQPLAMTMYAWALATGERGIVQDRPRAVAMLADAVSAHCPLAIHWAACRADFGVGMEANDSVALHNYLAAARAGWPGAINSVGGWYSAGRPPLVRRGRDSALRLFRRAALLGDRTAWYNQGMSSEKGWERPIDEARAEEWYRLSYDAGFEQAGERLDGLFGVAWRDYVEPPADQQSMFRTAFPQPLKWTNPRLAGYLD